MRFSAARFTAAIVAPFVLLAAASPVPLDYPSSPPGPVVDTYFGTTVADP